MSYRKDPEVHYYVNCVYVVLCSRNNNVKTRKCTTPQPVTRGDARLVSRLCHSHIIYTAQWLGAESHSLFSLAEGGTLHF
jgi:hypothetical protein